MQDTRRTIQAFLSLHSTESEAGLDLTGLIVQLAATTPAILYVFDLQDRHSIFLNRRIYDALGLAVSPGEEVRTDLLTRLMHPDDLQRVPEFVERFEFVTDNDVIHAEFRLRHDSGEWRWLSNRSVVFRRDGEGRPVQILTSAEDVTERRNAEEALQSKAAHLQAVLDTAVDAILTIDEVGTVETFNHAAERIFGYSAREVIGRNVRMLMPAPFHSGHDSYLAHYRQTGERKIIGIGREVTGLRKDGTTLPLDLAVSEAWCGRRVFTGILRDITEQTLQARLLKESEERLQLALDNAGLALWDWDLVQDRVHFDHQWEVLLGYSEQELTRHITLGSSFVHPEDREMLMEVLQNHLNSNDNAYDVEYRARHRSGHWIWLHLRGRVHSRDASGRALRMIGTIQDITERKQAEEILRESESRFHLLADSAPVLIWTSGLDTLCDYFNKPWLDFTGRSLEEEVGNGWAFGVHAEDVQRCLEKYLLSFERRESFRMEYRLRRHDGEYRWVLDTGTPRFSPEGIFMGYIGSCIDITDQKILQDQLFESQKLESLGRLAGGVAHDFNNLLTAILGYTELSLLSLPEEAEVRPFLNNVSGAGQRAAELTKQLLMYARRQMVEFTSVDINQVILKMDPLLRRTIGEQYELVTLLGQDACCVNANTNQMEQVLTNLVVNARDAMPEGGRIVIETGCIILDDEYARRHVSVVPGEYVMYSVSDTGIGMTSEVRNRIFEPFYTTKEAGKGTGLGLATCYGIVKQSKGNIWVYSEPGKGTTFKVYLPRIHDTDRVVPVRLPDNLPEGTETILLVDDEPMVRDIAARTLRSQGYRVLEASNGAEALHRQSEWPGEIDLLLSDVVMPLMGGKELAQRLQELHPRLKVLYMSGYTQNVVLQQGVLKPGVVLLTKPFTAADLAQKVRQVLGTYDS